MADVFSGGIMPQVIENRQGLQNIEAQRAQMDAMQRQQQMQDEAMQYSQQYIESVNAGKPDSNLLYQATLRSPEMSKSVLGAIGVVDAQQKQRLANDIASGNAAIRSRNKTEAMKWAAKRVSDIKASGGDPKDTKELAQMIMAGDWDAVDQAMAVVSAALVNDGALKPELAGFGGQAEPMTAFQAASTNLRQQELEFNKQQKMTENKLKVLEAKLKSEENELRREQMKAQIQETQADLEKKRQELDQAKKSKESGKLLVADAYNEVNSLLSNKDLGSAIGTVETSLPTVFGSTQDVINKASRLQSLLTVDNLKLMSGVLTDKDIQFLTNVASGLNVTEGGIKGSEEGVRLRLQQIKERLESAANQQGIDLRAGSKSGDSGESGQNKAVDWSSL